ncbi:E3 ubiquitin/ISG15 ligase TRIM25-like [Rhynochetos jubatus]
MAVPGPVAGLEEELTCPICLGIFSNPVSLCCGHSFCRECIQEAYHSHQRCLQGPFHCPLCYTQADPTMELQPNHQLRSIAQRFLDAPAHQEEKEHEAECEEKGKSSDEQGKVILCDFCLQEPQPAVKTCLSCEASLCQAHLSRHSTKSPLKDHVLMEPCDAQFLAERRCPQHGKLLECYCKTDSVCICVLCCVTNIHKNHKIITLEEAFGQAQSVLPETLKTVKTYEAALNQSIAGLLKQEEEVKSKESLRSNRLESLFEDMHLQLDNKKQEILTALSRHKEQQLSRIQTQQQQHKGEKDAASHDVQELEALRDQKDLLLFVKAFAEIQARKRKPVPKKVGVKLPMPPIILNELTTDSSLRLFRQFLSDMQSLLEAPPVHEHLTASLCGIGGYASNSKVVFPPTRSPFQYGLSNVHSSMSHVQSDQSFSEGCHFWEVNTSNAKDWKLGIVCPSCESYLEMSHEYLSVFLGNTVITRKSFPTAIKVVRVELDCRRNRLSFYNASAVDGDPAASLRPIETISIPLSYPIHALFGLSGGSLTLL